MRKFAKPALALFAVALLAFVLANTFYVAPKDTDNPKALISFGADISASVSPTAAAPLLLPTPTAIAKSTSAYRFIVMADSRGADNGINAAAVTKTMQALKKLKPQPSFAILIGDLVQGSKSNKTTLSQLKSFERLATKFYPEEFFFPGLGNHEVTSGNGGETSFATVFNKFQGKFLPGYNRTVYYFDKGDDRFFMLNTNHPGESERISVKQLNWLKQNIKDTAKNNFFFFHEPAYPTGPHIGSSLDKYPASRDALWKVIDGTNNPLVFSGHEHFYSRRHIEKDKIIYQITTGSFGAPIQKVYKDKTGVDVAPKFLYSFCVVDVTDVDVKCSVYSLSGKLIDSFYAY